MATPAPYEARSCGDAPPLAGAPGAAGSGQGLTVPPGRSRHAVYAGDSADGGEESGASVTLTCSRLGSSEVPSFDRKVMV